MAKKFLIIDMNIIMYSCIGLYEDKVTGEKQFGDFWQFVNEVFNMDQHLQYDADLLKKINSVIKKNIITGAEFHAVKDYEEVIEGLRASDIFGMTEEENLITYAGYRHNLGYAMEHDAEVFDFDKYSEDDWLGYLYAKSRLRIEWYKTPTSDIRSTDRFTNLSLHQVRKMDEIEEGYDEVYLIGSDKWIPYKFMHLYELLKEAYS